MVGLFANSGDPDQTQHSMASDLGLHCLSVMHLGSSVFNGLSYIEMWLCWGLTTRQPLWVILCRLPEKGRKKIEEIVEEMKERDSEERGTGIKWRNRRNKNIPPLPFPVTRIAGLAQMEANISWTHPWWKDDNERLWAMKCHTVMSWITPPAGLEPSTSWSEVGSARPFQTWLGHRFCTNDCKSGCLDWVSQFHKVIH